MPQLIHLGGQGFLQLSFSLLLCAAVTVPGRGWLLGTISLFTPILELFCAKVPNKSAFEQGPPPPDLAYLCILRPIAKLYFSTPDTTAYIFPSETCSRSGVFCAPFWHQHMKTISQTALSICHRYKQATCFCSLEQFYLTCLCNSNTPNRNDTNGKIVGTNGTTMDNDDRSSAQNKHKIIARNASIVKINATILDSIGKAVYANGTIVGRNARPVDDNANIVDRNGKIIDTIGAVVTRTATRNTIDARGTHPSIRCHGLLVLW